MTIKRHSTIVNYFIIVEGVRSSPGGVGPFAEGNYEHVCTQLPNESLFWRKGGGILEYMLLRYHFCFLILKNHLCCF